MVISMMYGVMSKFMGLAMLAENSRDNCIANTSHYVRNQSWDESKAGYGAYALSFEAHANVRRASPERSAKTRARYYCVSHDREVLGD